MEQLRLIKKESKRGFEYQILNEEGKVIRCRASKKEYVACTADGRFYFGRLDLVGKGDHGKSLRYHTAMIENPGRYYDMCVKGYVQVENKLRFIEQNPKQEWIKRNVEIAKGFVEGLGTILYL